MPRSLLLQLVEDEAADPRTPALGIYGEQDLGVAPGAIHPTVAGDALLILDAPPIAREQLPGSVIGQFEDARGGATHDALFGVVPLWRVLRDPLETQDCLHPVPWVEHNRFPLFGFW